MRIVDPLRKPDVSATPRPVLPPFLPTLGLAVVAALLSLACREPAKQSAPEPAASARSVPAMAAAPGLTVFDPGRALLADIEAGPASEAFARLVPLVAAGEAAPSSARPPRVAARPERRRAPASRMATTQPASPQRSAEPVVPAPAPMARAEEEEDRFLPTGALPFAAVDAAWDAARRVGAGTATGVATGVATLGSSVVGLVSDLR
jgi:hypothetical protein